MIALMDPECNPYYVVVEGPASQKDKEVKHNI